MKNRARVGGHPLHPIMVVLPLGSFTMSLVFDVVYLISGNPFWYAMGFWLMVAGVVTGLLAGVPGLIDYTTSIPPAARQTARRHGMINGAIIVLYIVNAILRLNSPVVGSRMGLSIFLNLVGVAALGYTGYLGGELIYRYRVGIDEAQLPTATTLTGPRPEPGSDVEEKRVA